MIATLRSINSKTRALDGANAVGTMTGGPRMCTPISKGLAGDITRRLRPSHPVVASFTKKISDAE
jgi:hypothetical protein